MVEILGTFNEFRSIIFPNIKADEKEDFIGAARYLISDNAPTNWTKRIFRYFYTGVMEKVSRVKNVSSKIKTAISLNRK